MQGTCVFEQVKLLLILTHSHGVKLHDLARTTDPHFIPRNYEPSKLPPTMIQQPGYWQQSPLTSTSDSPGFLTPMPEPSLSSSPAWDPSSSTPCHPSSSTPRHDPVHNPSSSDPPGQDNHILLNPQLLNAPLRVAVTGGMYDNREMTVVVSQSTSGSLSIRRVVHKASEFLEPEWVSPRHPNPTRDNGLLIIVKGSHCGKYVRRIHHRYVGDSKTAVVILGVVNRVAGEADTLTGEQLELDSSQLCLCDESKEDKKLNSTLMDTLRMEARKVRAK